MSKYRKMFESVVASVLGESVRHDTTHIHVTSHEDYEKHMKQHNPDAKAVKLKNNMTQHQVGNGNVVGHWDPEHNQGKVKRNPSIKMES